MAFDAQSTSEVARVVCSKLVTTDVELRIRHGTNLLLRNVEWAVLLVRKCRRHSITDARKWNSIISLTDSDHTLGKKFEMHTKEEYF